MADETTQPDSPVGEPTPQDAAPVEPAEAAPLPSAVPEEAVVGEMTAEMPAEPAAAPAAAANNAIDQTELDALTGGDLAAALAVAEAAPEPASVVGATQFTAPELSAGNAAAVATIDLLNDVRLDVKIELGRTNMYIEDVLKLGVGSVVELDKLAGDPVDIYVSDRLVARGEVLVLNENFCVRINDIHSPVPELDAN
jgi:flagellar motor switch protein FliN/FliY